MDSALTNHPNHRARGGKRAPSTLSVLPPQAATEKCNNQSFVFGTSSQLAGPESPTYLRDLQRALDESGREAHSEWEAKVPRQARIHSSRSNVTSAPLWSAASCSSQTAVHSLEAGPGASDRESEDSERSHGQRDNRVGDSDVPMAPFARSPTARARGTATRDATEKDTNRLKASRGKEPRVATPAPLAPDVIRGPRGKTIARRSDEFIPVDEIEDSEPDRPPSPRRSPSTSNERLQLSSQPPPLESSAKHQTEEEREAGQAELFAAITKSVREAPRGSISEPSWHERMLMFEPVVLEDLTDWLNSIGLRFKSNGSKEEELTSAVVRQWCDDQSVCCVWRLTRRKQTRKGAAGE